MSVSLCNLCRVDSWGTTPLPSVIIDLSAIVLLEGESAPNWGWVESSVQAWRKQQDPKAVFYGVADSSLWYRLDESGKESLSRWKRRGMARSVRHADPVILDLATRFEHSSVLTTDLYRDKRREFPWLQGTSRVWKPVMESGVRFTQLDMAPIPDEQVSWFVEKADLTPRGFKTKAAIEELKYEWRCQNDSCRWFATVMDSDPEFRDGRVVCPECNQPAKKLGLRSATREIVLLLGDHEVERLPLAVGGELTLGRMRGPDRFDVRTVLEEDQANRISRDHLTAINKDGRVFLEDLNSKNGTEIIRPDGSGVPLKHGIQQLLNLGDRLRLAGGILSLRLSGKQRTRGKYQSDLTTPPFAR